MVSLQYNPLISIKVNPIPFILFPEIPRPHHKSKHGGGTETNDILKHKTGKYKPTYSGSNNNNDDDEDLNGSAEDFDDDSDSEKMPIKPTNRPYYNHGSDKNRNHFHDSIIESSSDFEATGKGNIHVTYKPHNSRGGSNNIFGNNKENSMDNKGISIIYERGTWKQITGVILLLVYFYKSLWLSPLVYNNLEITS